METLLIVISLSAVAAGRLFAGMLAADFIESLPATERARIRRTAFSA